MAAFIYTVCAGDDYDNSKSGFTDTQNVWSYLDKNYARTMVPLTIRRVLKVPKGRLGESLLFAAIEPFQKVCNHEVFAIPESELTKAYEIVKSCFDSLQSLNPSLISAVYLKRPDCPSEPRRIMGPTVRQAVIQKAADRRQERLTKFQQTVSSKELKEKTKKQLMRDSLNSFLARGYLIGPALRIKSQDLMISFESYFKLKHPDAVFDVDLKYFVHQMKELGFEKKRIRLPSSQQLIHGYHGQEV